MLVLSRKKNESIVIDGNIYVTVVNLGKNQVRIGIQAPSDVNISRVEVEENKMAVDFNESDQKLLLECAV